MAGRKVAELLIVIGANSYEFKQVTKQVEIGMDDLSRKLTNFGKNMSLAVTAPLTAIGAVALRNADIQERAEAKVQQAILQTGGAAKLTFEELTSYASELQGRSIFGDEQILNDVTGKLLTFTNIAGDNFKKAQQAALDMATVLDQDVKGIVTQLGKALNDPVKNLSALSRMGIQFSKEQETVIRKFAETNQLAEAQAIILDTLASRYGGQAEAASKVGLGALKQLKNAWGDFLEQIGSTMMPVVAKIAGALSKVVAVLQNMDPRIRKIIVIVAALAAAIGPVSLVLGQIMKILPLLKSGFLLLVAPIKAVVLGVKSLTAAISSNPIGLLLTALAAGVTLFMSFRKSTDEATEANGEFTRKIIDESTQVNNLIGKLQSATISEQERKAVLEELKRIQPDIVEGMTAESLELETLKKRASEYNQQLVLRIALARKQDQVAAAIEAQTEATVRQKDKEAELYKYLSQIEAKLNSGDFQFGRHNQNKGFYEWTQASEQMQRNLINHFNEIMASGDSMAEKARKVQLMFQPPTNYADKIRMDDVSMRKIRSVRGDIFELGQDVTEAADLVAQAEADVLNFAEAFSLSLTTAVEGATDSVDGLGGAAGNASNRTQKSISELTEKIQDLEKQKQESFDTAEIARFNAEIAQLKGEVDRLNGLGTNATQVKGRIVELNDQIKKLEETKNATFDVEVIADCNAEIAKLKEEVDRLNKILPEDLIPVPKLEPILTGDLANLKPILMPLEIKVPDLKLPMSKAAEQMRQIRDMVQQEMFGWTDNISGAFTADMLEVSTIVQTYVDSLMEKGYSFSSALELVGSKVSETMKSFDESLSNFLANSIVAAAEAIGQIMAGDLGFGGLMKAILLQFANFLKNIGAQLIEFAIMMIAFKSALKSVLANPWAALAVGAAMVAAAAVMTALINKKAKENAPKLAKGGLAYGATYAMVGDNPNARVDPEVIAPLSKLRDMMPAGGASNVNIALSGELKAKGRDLIYVLGKENFKIDLLGG